MGTGYGGGMNFKELAKNLEMEEEEFLEMVNLFLETTTSDLGKLQSSIEEKDTQKVAETAHSIKGAAANLGFEEMYEVAKRIEKKARENDLNEVVEAIATIREKLDRIAQNLPKG
jgi:HPt (histidine-containing phosphotransfer) domain-containing protein